jgi:uncharacterized protein YutE (UPF0331/DUF86 family)
VSRDRATLLETSIKRRLSDAQRHLTALENAAAEFGDDFDLDAFERAWLSEAPDDLKRAYAVQAGYENVINACIAIAQELAELKGWSDRGMQPTSVQALKLLHENGVIAAATRSALKEAQERRSDVQHDYVNVAARDIHAATQKVLEQAPVFLQDVAAIVRKQ